MRRENFFIALHNRGLLDLRVCGRKYAWQTQTLDWYGYSIRLEPMDCPRRNFYFSDSYLWCRSLEYALWTPIFEAMAAGVPIREADIPRLTTAYVLPCA